MEWCELGIDESWQPWVSGRLGDPAKRTQLEGEQLLVCRPCEPLGRTMKGIVERAMEVLRPGGQLLIPDTLSNLVGSVDEREQTWRTRWRMHTIFVVDGEHACGWLTKGLWPADGAIRLVPISLPARLDG